MSRMCAKAGIHSAAVGKQTRHLPYNHVSMRAVREWVATAVEYNKVDPRLMAHFDQVWSVHFEPSKRVLWKDASKHSEQKDPMKPSEKAMLSRLKEALGVPSSEPPKTEHTVEMASLNAQSTLVPVDQARVARTTTTLAWSDGTMGRAYITAPSTVVRQTQSVSTILYL